MYVRHIEDNSSIHEKNGARTGLINIELGGGFLNAEMRKPNFRNGMMRLRMQEKT